ncbi:unnamed protein product [Ilex paraguariensis]|uniref:Uncharacterized protein n=1 Tax=Ilex paraguariensis TaxID=185542 RepID=A0ABC8UTI8_9AQUA
MKRIYECGNGEYLIGKPYGLNWGISKGVGEPGSHVNNTILMQIYDSSAILSGLRNEIPNFSETNGRNLMGSEDEMVLLNDSSISWLFKTLRGSYQEDEIKFLKSQPTKNNVKSTFGSLDDAVDEILVPATQHSAVNGGSDVECTDAKEEDFEHFSDTFADTEAPSHVSISAAETENFKSTSETLDYTIDSFVTATETEVSSGSTIERQDSDGRRQFSLASISEDIGITSFIFAAFSCAQAPALSRTDRDKCEAVKEEEVGQETVSTPFASIAAQEACEKWRLRGNQAYAKGDTTKAEDCYTQGVNSVSQNETSRSCLRALMLCYSNRAAARMSLGRMREALEDCMRAAALDPNFLRVQVRAAK